MRFLESKASLAERMKDQTAMLIDAISATRRASEQLLQVLEDEFEALKRRDAEWLVQLTARKQTQNRPCFQCFDHMNSRSNTNFPG